MATTALWFERALLAGGWAEKVRLELADGRIADIHEGVEPQAGDARGGAAAPGLCNVHSHAFQRGMAGLTERMGREGDDFWTWRALMYRFLDRMTPEHCEAIAALAFAEMLEAGFTRVGEFHYLHHDPNGGPYAELAVMAEAVVAAAQATGIGLTLLPGYYAQGDFGGVDPTHGQRRFINDPDRFARLLADSRAALAPLPDAKLGVAPHSLRAVTAQDLARVTAMAGPGAPIHIHAAEQVKEVEACVAWSGARPVAWLLDHADVDTRWTLIHATHLDASETARLAASGAVAGLCPITEADLGDGVFPAEAYLAAGGRFGVGTDSNVRIDAAAELRGLEYSQRLVHRRRNVLASRERRSTGARLFHGALQGGAQALGVSDAAGLVAGASADIVELDTGHAALGGLADDRLIDAWVFCAGREAVKTVWRRGVRVVSDGRAHGHPAILDRYRKTLRALTA